ncbi:MAG TPA: excinuclease ABC subunit A, partial [Sutterella sp.]|nr:excinuclease ABC subunit A [Sutterella sp.]
KTVSTAKFPRLSRFNDHTIELPIAEVEVTESNREQLLAKIKETILLGKGTVRVVADTTESLFSVTRSCPRCGKGFPELDPRLFSFNSSMGWCPTCKGTGLILNTDFTGDIEEERTLDWSEGRPCPACSGERLNPTALAVRFAGKNIAQLSAMTIAELSKFFGNVRLSSRESVVAQDALAEIVSRLKFLLEVGLGYLTLERSSPSLSGGEAQRIRLAGQLGSNLQGVAYILDEPTIGLHPRDNRLLIDTLRSLTDKGNSLIVVEHDEDTIREADFVIDIGPGAGVAGGQVVGSGSMRDLMANPASITGQLLKNPTPHTFTSKIAVDASTPRLTVLNPKLNNLKPGVFEIPLGRLTVITGVSGSGKSSFATGVLLPAVKKALEERTPYQGPLCEAVKGEEVLRRVLEVDQTPIGKTPRSCPATYIGFMDDIRRIFAGTNDAKEKGFDASRFSFNTGAGRCPVCEGRGSKTVEMHFLPDMTVPCEACGGLRFNEETLNVKWKDKSIGEILEMDVDSALAFFETHPKIYRALSLMQDVGLGYLTLGQSSPTLSGGEAQRIKLVTELVKAVTDNAKLAVGKTLYILDEPTVGLHMADVRRLTDVMHRLTELGNTVVVIEHNLDVIAEADWIIDLGPEGGDAGGAVVAQGDAKTVMKSKTHTGKALAQFAADHGFKG